jgi:peptidoglycan hydrolase-like protein with peptidoglycan-binding domain
MNTQYMNAVHMCGVNQAFTTNTVTLDDVRKGLRVIGPGVKAKDSNDTSDPVIYIQVTVGAVADGKYTDDTAKKVSEFQKKYGIGETGIVNQTTIQLIDLVALGKLPSNAPDPVAAARAALSTLTAPGAPTAPPVTPPPTTPPQPGVVLDPYASAPTPKPIAPTAPATSSAPPSDVAKAAEDAIKNIKEKADKVAETANAAKTDAEKRAAQDAAAALLALLNRYKAEVPAEIRKAQLQGDNASAELFAKLATEADALSQAANRIAKAKTDEERKQGADQLDKLSQPSNFLLREYGGLPVYGWAAVGAAGLYALRLLLSRNDRAYYGY